MSGFIESPFFPYVVSAWAVGGRGYKTTVVETYGGNEYRTAAWSQARGEWDVSDAFTSTNPNSVNAYTLVRNMARVCMGQLYAFRFRDPMDYTDEGAGIFIAIDSTHFQMYKQYSYSPLTDNQIIQKPEPVNSLSPGYGGIVISGGGSYSLDYTTGIVHKTGGADPTAWTGQFHVPCRFAQDVPRMGYDQSGALMDWQELKIIEVRNP